MVYSNKFVLCVLRDGVPLKELANGTIVMPFGEYALRFRNKNNRRALVKFFIDGEDVSGAGYIIPANDHIDIERWAQKAVKFNFVPLDSPEAVDYGKNGPNYDKIKGTIEARFYLEQQPKPYCLSTIPPFEVHRPRCPNPFQKNYLFKINSPNEKYDWHHFSPFRSANTISDSTPVNSLAQDGCTVEGSTSYQQFHSVDFIPESDYVTLKVFLQGSVSKEPHSVILNEKNDLEKQIQNIKSENLRLQKEIEENKKIAELEETLRILKEENEKLKQKAANKV